MHQILPIPHWISRVCGMLCAIFVSTIGVADETRGPTRSWSLRDEFQTGPAGGNPIADRRREPVWHLLRTTSSKGPVESRKWLRDGRYVPLGDAGDKLFGSPLDGWAYRAKNPLAPAVGKITADYDIGLKFQPGDILIAPGPDHAIVVGWRSPVSGTLDIQGVFEHAQTLGNALELGLQFHHGLVTCPAGCGEAPATILAVQGRPYP